MPLLNYFLLTGKLHLWDCRRSQISPTIAGFETKKYICTKNETLNGHYFLLFNIDSYIHAFFVLQ